MRIVVRGEPYTLSRITIGEAAAMERVTGKTFEQLSKGNSLAATQALVWIAMRRANPAMRFSDTDDIPFEDIAIELDDDEIESAATDSEEDGTAPLDVVAE